MKAQVRKTFKFKLEYVERENMFLTYVLSVSNFEHPELISWLVNSSEICSVNRMSLECSQGSTFHL